MLPVIRQINQRAGRKRRARKGREIFTKAADFLAEGNATRRVLVRQRRLILFLIVRRKQRPVCTLFQGCLGTPPFATSTCRLLASSCSPLARKYLQLASNMCMLRSLFPKLLLAFVRFITAATTARRQAGLTNDEQFTREHRLYWRGGFSLSLSHSLSLDICAPSVYELENSSMKVACEHTRVSDAYSCK